jgi:hypothetical protein
MLISAEYATLRTSGGIKRGVERTAVSAVVAFLFLLQMFSVGVATGATANGAAALLGGVCEKVEASTSRDEGAPAKTQHVGPCCLLHCSSMIESEVERTPDTVLPLEMFTAPAALEYRIDAVIAAPELRPLSPRAPPAPRA